MAEEETKEVDYSSLPFKLRVLKAQNELKAPKNQYNSFGKYHYRSAEDILEAAKKVNYKYYLLLRIEDNVEQYNEHLFLKATATLSDVSSEESISVSAIVKIPPVKKGMDDSQITGAASSYARKYCLNGLYCIDDTKDADSEEVQAKDKQQKNSKNNQAINALGNTLKQIANLASVRDHKPYTENTVYEGICSQVVGKIISSDALTPQQLQQIQLQANAMLQQFNASK